MLQPLRSLQQRGFIQRSKDDDSYGDYGNVVHNNDDGNDDGSGDGNAGSKDYRTFIIFLVLAMMATLIMMVVLDAYRPTGTIQTPNSRYLPRTEYEAPGTKYGAPGTGRG